MPLCVNNKFRPSSVWIITSATWKSTKRIRQNQVNFHKRFTSWNRIDHRASTVDLCKALCQKKASLPQNSSKRIIVFNLANALVQETFVFPLIIRKPTALNPPAQIKARTGNKKKTGGEKQEASAIEYSFPGAF